MKVALIRKDYLLSRGGGERYAVNLSEELTKLGHELHIFAHKWEETNKPGITFHKVPILTTFSPLKNLSFACNCRRMLAREKFDIIFSLSQTYCQDVYRMGDGIHRHWMRIQSGNKFWKILKYFSARHLMILFLESQTFKRHNYRKIIANSRLVKDQAISYYQIPEDQIDVIYNGVDQDRFNPQVKNLYRHKVRQRFGLKEDEIVILFVARNFRRKGLVSIIESLAMMNNERDKIKLLIAGKSNPRHLLRLAKRINLEKKLIFGGETERIEEFYAAGDIFVLPSLYEPFANACLEALACGLPVITTKTNGASELIEEGKNGFVIKDNFQIKELSNKILKLMPKSVREEMGRYASKIAKQYTLNKNARKTERIFQEILVSKREFTHFNDNKIIVNKAYEQILTKSEFTSFSMIMGYQGGEIVKKVIKERFTVKLNFKGNNGEFTAYLKRYQYSGKDILKSLLKFSGLRSARHEWQNILEFQSMGIPTMTPMAVGESKKWGISKESFLLTKGIEDVEKLENIIPQYFSPPLNREQLREKRLLIMKLAALTKRMHQSGFNHRDFYLTHILVKRDSSKGEWFFYIADLHRVDIRKKVSLRWKIKDIAALNYSAPKDYITNTDRIIFLKNYLGDNPSKREYRYIIRKILRRNKKTYYHNLKSYLKY